MQRKAQQQVLVCMYLKRLAHRSAAKALDAWRHRVQLRYERDADLDHCKRMLRRVGVRHAFAGWVRLLDRAASLRHVLLQRAVKLQRARAAQAFGGWVQVVWRSVPMERLEVLLEQKRVTTVREARDKVKRHCFLGWIKYIWRHDRPERLRKRRQAARELMAIKADKFRRFIDAIKLSILDTISQCRKSFKIALSEENTYRLADYTKQWQTAIAHEKMEAKRDIAVKVEEDASILMCDILEVAESCMQELARMQDLTLVDSAPDRLGDSDGEDAGPKGEDRHIKQIDAEEKKIEAQLALLSPVTKRTLTIEDQGLLKKCMMRWMSKPWNNMLATAFMEIRRARLSLQQISRAQMQELQSMVNPPKLVKLALEALCTLLYGWSHSKWEGIRKILHHEDFGPSLMKYRGQNLTPELVELLDQKYIANPQFTEATIGRASKACAPLVLLIQSHVAFRKLTTRFEESGQLESAPSTPPGPRVRGL